MDFQIPCFPCFPCAVATLTYLAKYLTQILFEVALKFSILSHTLQILIPDLSANRY